MRRYSYKYKPRSVKNKEKKAAVRLITYFVIAIVLVYLLLTWGLPALIGGLSYFHKAKTPSNNANAIEDTAITPPVLNIPYEATNTGTIKINGYSTPDAKVEIYLDDDLRTTVNTESDGSFQSDDIDLALGTNNISSRTVDEKGNKSLPSKNIKVIYSNEKPLLQISEPQDGQEIKGGDKKIKVSGSTDPDNSISINGSTIIINSEGKFSQDISINEGDNTITITATNKVGNSATTERRVKYTP